MALENHIAATESPWADIEFLLENLRESHGAECVEREAVFIRGAHSEFLAESDSMEEFETRFSDWLIDRIGPTEA